MVENDIQVKANLGVLDRLTRQKEIISVDTDNIFFLLEIDSELHITLRLCGKLFTHGIKKKNVTAICIYRTS